MRMKSSVLPVALVAMSLLGFGATPCVAAPPQFVTFHFDREVTDTLLCGFPIQVHDEGDVRIAIHFDAQGNIEWVNDTTSDYRITLTNPANGISLWTPSPEHIIETAFATTN